MVIEEMRKGELAENRYNLKTKEQRGKHTYKYQGQETILYREKGTRENWRGMRTLEMNQKRDQWWELVYASSRWELL